MGRLRSLLLFACAMLALSACQVRGVVEIDVDDDASGTVSVAVSLDDEALARIDDLGEQLQIADMADAGWVVSAPQREDDGLTWIRASKSFDAPAELGPVAAETGVLEGVTLERERSFANTAYRVDGVADLAGGMEQFGDAELASLLGGRAVGFDLAELEAELGPLADLSDLTVIVRLPGDIEDAPGADVDGPAAAWTVRLDDAGPTPVVADANLGQTSPKLWMLGAGVTAVAAGGALLFTLLQWLGARRRVVPAGRGTVAPRPGAAPTAVGRPAPGSATTKPEATSERRLELVVLDGMGVLFRTGDNIGRILVPFARSHGAVVDDDTIAETYRQASMGRLSTAEFWAAIGVDGNADELDQAYVAEVELSPGATRFLRKAREQGLAIACLTNSVNKWMKLLSDRHQLEPLVDYWLVSSSIGARKPDTAAFEALRRKSGVPFHNCLMLDDRPEHLDAARRLGMSTALFDPDGELDQDAHRVVASFASFF